MRAFWLSIQNHLIASHLTQKEIQNTNTIFPSSLYLVTSLPTSLSLILATLVSMLSSNITDSSNTSLSSLYVPYSLNSPFWDANSLNSFRFLLKLFFSIRPSLQAQKFPASLFSIVFVTTWDTIHLLIYSFVSISSPQNECKLHLSFNFCVYLSRHLINSCLALISECIAVDKKYSEKRINSIFPLID